MSKFLVRTVETYRVDSESEAAAAIEQAKKDNKFQLAKYTNEYKETKNDAYYKLTLTKDFNSLKEPTTYVDINYDVDNDWLGPRAVDEEEE